VLGLTNAVDELAVSGSGLGIEVVLNEAVSIAAPVVRVAGDLLCAWWSIVVGRSALLVVVKVRTRFDPRQDLRLVRCVQLAKARPQKCGVLVPHAMIIEQSPVDHPCGSKL